VDSPFPPLSLPEFLDQLPDGLFIADGERRIVFSNRAAEELAGYSREELAGKRCFDPHTFGFKTLLGRELSSEEDCLLFQSMSSRGSPEAPAIVLLSTRDGKAVPVSLRVSLLHDGSGEAVGTVATFRGMREEYQQRKLALEIQRRMITRGELSRDGVRIDTLYSPVEEIGGDFLEAFFLDDGTLIATVADATGHGMTASLFTLVFKTLLHAAFARYRAPMEVLGEVNRGFIQLGGIEGYYLSACIVRYDPRTGKGSYAAAGHPEGLIFHREGEGFRLKRKLHIVSFMLAIEETTVYEEMPFSLEEGEFLLLASDGLFESECYNGVAFGVPGIARFFGGNRGARPLEGLLAAVRKESRYPRLPDDVSMIRIAAMPVSE
jgi:PAS domain S-box-containing protein